MFHQIYAPPMPYTCLMPKLLEIHQWGKCTNTNARYELTGIKYVTRSTVHRWCSHRMMMPTQDDKAGWQGCWQHSLIIYTELATWPNQSKPHLYKLFEKLILHQANGQLLQECKFLLWLRTMLVECYNSWHCPFSWWTKWVWGSYPRKNLIFFI